MALLDFLKRKKEAEKSQALKEKKPQSVSVVPKASEKKIAVHAKASQSKGFSYDVVKEPHISEKATLLAEKNQYVFLINSNVNKPEIKKAIKGIYGVDALAVSLIRIPKKKRRLGRTEGFRKAYRKAVVTVKAGQKIEIF